MRPFLFASLPLLLLAGCASEPASAQVEVVEWRFTPEDAAYGPGEAPAGPDDMAEKKKAMLLQQQGDDAMAKQKAMQLEQQGDDAMAKQKAMQLEQQGASRQPAQSDAERLRAFLLSEQWARMAGLDFHTFSGQDATHRGGGRVSGAGVAVVDPRGAEVPLERLLDRPSVLVFMRGFYGNVCPYCTTYTAQLATRYEEFVAAGANLIVIYPTRAEDAAEVETFKQLVAEVLAEEGEEAIPFPVYLDRGLRVVGRYNLSGDVSKPSTLVLDREGAIRYLYVGRNTADRPDLDRVLAEARQASE